jgi:hypothetical protein
MKLKSSQCNVTLFRPLILAQAIHTLFHIKGLVSHLRASEAVINLLSSVCNLFLFRPLILVQAILHIIGLIPHLQSFKMTTESNIH